MGAEARSGSLVGARLQHAGEYCRPKGKAGEQDQGVQIFLDPRTGLLPTRLDCIRTHWQKPYQSLGDSHVIRSLRSTDGHSSDHRRERLGREDLRQSCEPSGLLPGVYTKSRQRRNDTQRYSVLLITDRGEEKVVQIRTEH